MNNINIYLLYVVNKQGPTRHRTMAHLVVLDIFPQPQRLQNMPFIAYGGARPLAGLGHVCSRLFS